MPSVKVNDINMYYEIHGDGYPFVSIGGLNHNIYKYHPTYLELLSKNFKTILFDNRGAGKTDQPDIEYSIKMMADDTAGLMDVLNIERAIVLGSSMGGMIAQELILNYPEKVEKLILCSTNCGGSKSVPPSKEILQLLTQNTKGMTEEEIIRMALPVLYTKEFLKNNVDYIEDYIRRALIIPTNPKAYLRQIGAVIRFNSFKRLKNINTPTLVMHGKKDILVPPQNGEILAGLIPNAKLSLHDNNAHLLFSEETEKVFNRLLKFLL